MACFVGDRKLSMLIAGAGLNLPSKDNSEIVITPGTHGCKRKFLTQSFPSYCVS